MFLATLLQHVIRKDGRISNGGASTKGIHSKAEESLETKVQFIEILVTNILSFDFKRKTGLSIRNSVAPGDEDGGEPKTWKDMLLT